MPHFDVAVDDESVSSDGDGFLGLPVVVDGFDCCVVIDRMLVVVFGGHVVVKDKGIEMTAFWVVEGPKPFGFCFF